MHKKVLVEESIPLGIKLEETPNKTKISYTGDKSLFILHIALGIGSGLFGTFMAVVFAFFFALFGIESIASFLFFNCYWIGLFLLASLITLGIPYLFSRTYVQLTEDDIWVQTWTWRGKKELYLPVGLVKSISLKEDAMRVNQAIILETDATDKNIYLGGLRPDSKKANFLHLFIKKQITAFQEKNQTPKDV